MMQEKTLRSEILRLRLRMTMEGEDDTGGVG